MPQRTPTVRYANPWKSLQSYTEEDRDIFFGRKRELEEFLTLIRRGTLSVLFAQSGLGKTSLLCAGVIPRLREDGFFPVYLRLDYKAGVPLSRQIIDATITAATGYGIAVEETAEVSSAAAVDSVQETLWEFYHRHAFWGARNDFTPPVLLLDQFEELFTLGQQLPDARELHTQLADLVENRMPQSVQERIEVTGERLTYDTRARNFKVIVSLREDFVPRLDSLRRSMPSVMANRFMLGPLNWDRGIEIIRRGGGQWVSENVARDIVAAVANVSESETDKETAYTTETTIEPAYLSVMCHELFRHMIELKRNEIGADLVAAEKGNILDSFYERSFNGLDAGARSFVEDHLLTASGFRNAVPLPDAEHEVPLTDLETLVERRLLRFEPRFGVPHVELSHDLLTHLVQKSRDKRLAEAVLAADQLRAEELREELRKTVRRVWAAALAVVFLIGVSVFVYFGWWFPSESYAKSFAKRWGKIHPVGILPGSAVNHRSATLRFIRKGWFGDVQAVEAVDANGRLTSQHDIGTYLTGSDTPQTPQEKASSYQFVYDRTGCIVYEIARNRLGQMVWGFVYAPPRYETTATTPQSTGSIWHSLAKTIRPAECLHEQRTATYVGPEGLPRPQGDSRAEFIDIRYNAQGFEAEMHFKDQQGNPMPGPDNAYGQRREYDGEGRQVRMTSLDQFGKPMNDEVGNASAESKYDQDGNIAEARYSDANGEPTLIEGGVYRMTFKHDQWGRQTEARFFGLSDEPVIYTKQIGAHWVSLDYDYQGNIKHIRLYSKADQPVIAGENFFEFSAHEQRMSYDSLNRTDTVAYFDQEEKPLAGPEGWHGIRYEYDENSFINKTIVFDTAGDPVNARFTGASRWEAVNDHFGQAMEERFFDAEGVPVATHDGGYHLRKSEYDSAGNLIEQTYFDINDKPTVDQTDGAHRFVQGFDRFRHPLYVEYFDKANKRINNKQGFHRRRMTYDDYGALLESRWENKEGRPCNGPYGVAIVRNEYDHLGRRMRVARFDADQQPATGRDGIHEMHFDYNNKRQQTKWQYFGLNREPMEDEDGDHLFLKEFNDRGRETGITRLRANGAPNLDRELGIATRRMLVDKENRPIEQAYYDERQNPVIGPYGFAKGTVVYHDDGRIEHHHFGSDGKLAYNALVGYAIKKMDPREQGETTEAYYGPDGALITGPEGYAQVRRHWSDDGILLHAAWFGPDGSPVVGPGGYHRVEQIPGKLSTTTKYYDTQSRELSLVGPDTVESVIYISEIINIKQPAVEAGLRAGDVLWRYGDWIYPKAMATERAKGMQSDEAIRATAEAMLQERDRHSAGSVRVTVIRNGKVVTLTMPALPEKAFGAELMDRAVPVTTYKEWEIAVEQNGDFDSLGD